MTTDKDELREILEKYFPCFHHAGQNCHCDRQQGLALATILNAGYIKKDEIEVDEEKIKESILNQLEIPIQSDFSARITDKNIDGIAHAIAQAGKEIIC